MVLGNLVTDSEESCDGFLGILKQILKNTEVLLLGNLETYSEESCDGFLGILKQILRNPEMGSCES